MKLIFTSIIALAVAAAPRGCGKQQTVPGCYKGRLEVKGICSNYTIKVLEGQNADWTQASWTDEQTGKKHTQVFKLANPCAFPANLKEGNTFYFTLDTAKQEQCAVCMAYYPTPEKAAAIKVLPDGCK